MIHVNASIPRMVAIMSQSSGYLLLFVFGAAMVVATYIFARVRPGMTRESFLVARRDMNWILSGTSIAASWIWAGALFVSIQVAYQKGLAGIFWFTLPNILALLIFTRLGTKIRDKFALGYTLPEYVGMTLKSPRVQKLYLLPFFFGQLIAITFNVFAGGAVIAFLTGIPLTVVMPLLIIIALVYTWISGLEASIITDFLQMVLIVAGIVVIVPLAIWNAGGIGAVAGGLTGTAGTLNVFDPWIMFSFGLVTSIGLISQTINDQQFWQRVFAVKREDIGRSFALGAILFALVPIALSALGFLAANPALGVSLPAGMDQSLIGVLSVGTFVGASAAVVYTVIMLSGLLSTIDSAMSATSSLWVTDFIPLFRTKRQLSDAEVVRQSRFAMALVSLLGLSFAYVSYYVAGFGIAQLFLISISVSAATAVPTVLSLYWDGLNERGVFWGILISIVIGMPLFFYANYVKSDGLTAFASLFMLVSSTLFCLFTPARRG